MSEVGCPGGGLAERETARSRERKPSAFGFHAYVQSGLSRAEPLLLFGLVTQGSGEDGSRSVRLAKRRRMRSDERNRLSPFASSAQKGVRP